MRWKQDQLCLRIEEGGDVGRLGHILRKYGGLESGLSEDPRRCSSSSHRCHHAAHAYTSIPCSVYTRGISGVRPSLNKERSKTVENSQDGWELFTPEDNKTKLIRDQHYRQLFQDTVPEKKYGGRGGDVLDTTKKYYVSFTIRPKQKGSANKSNMFRVEEKTF
ncbi:uncharacterized protein LOC111707038 [Eurytemora carolleeae]|uniref:uncharacterized protein LOC111707038 n=1 Tax=Eurytemora carolleeae TaxID=1294199 RepID=UPI000C758402|nr:uncharacterized protein LOC111707038 [Eurytemora carolleeae]|eukprot:XP_023335791.1 uncharacterized protein LOC111707038 [Eurytemora affinis]